MSDVSDPKGTPQVRSRSLPPPDLLLGVSNSLALSKSLTEALDTLVELTATTTDPDLEQLAAYDPEFLISGCLGPSNAPCSTRAIAVSLINAVNLPIYLVGVVNS